MSPVQTMMRSHPTRVEIDESLLIECIDACMEAEQACTACADACLSEPNLPMLRRCIRLNLDAADVCNATARVLSRQTDTSWGLVSKVLQACIQACRDCGAECQAHADHHEHCRACADACRRCEQSCTQLQMALPT